jgi:hypothetical protein
MSVDVMRNAQCRMQKTERQRPSFCIWHFAFAFNMQAVQFGSLLDMKRSIIVPRVRDAQESCAADEVQEPPGLPFGQAQEIPAGGAVNGRCRGHVLSSGMHVAEEALECSGA